MPALPAGFRVASAITAAPAHGYETLSVVDGRLKIDPLAHWDRATIEAYRVVNALPEHPLAGRGYLSVGCVPCTSPAADADDPRAGRWAGRAKSECGIHFTRNGRPVRVISNGRDSAPPATTGD